MGERLQTLALWFEEKAIDKKPKKNYYITVWNIMNKANNIRIFNTSISIDMEKDDFPVILGY